MLFESSLILCTNIGLAKKKNNKQTFLFILPRSVDNRSICHNTKINDIFMVNLCFLLGKYYDYFHDCIEIEWSIMGTHHVHVQCVHVCHDGLVRIKSMLEIKSI